MIRATKEACQELVRLWKARTPKFNKRLQRASMGAAAAGLYFKTHNLDLEVAGVSVVNVLIGAGAISTVYNQLKEETPAAEPEPEKVIQ